MSNLFRLLWILLVIGTVLIIAFGARRGEWKRIKSNATILCTSCVGLEK
ncbi:MAG: thioredoxin [bacterium]